MPFLLNKEKDLLWLTSSLLGDVRHGFSTRRGGVSQPPLDSLNLGPNRGDDPQNVAENYRRFCGVLSLAPERTVLARQTHMCNVLAVGEEDAGKGLLRERGFDQVDALVTNTPGLAITVFSADCGEILLHDPVTGAVGAVHAGWRGCAGGILRTAVETMGEHYGTDPRDLRAAIGPCIGQCCFETDVDVPAAMGEALGREAQPFMERRGEKWHLDLAGLNRLWLLRAGVPEEQIDLCGLCTYCRQDLFWSHRRDGEARGVQAAMIAPNERT